MFLKSTYFKAVQKCLDARRARTVLRGVYRYTLSDAVCSATQQMSVFQQPTFHLSHPVINKNLNSYSN